MKTINDLYDYEYLKIVQDTNFFKFSIDSILLAEYVKVSNDDNNFLDLCAGNNPISLILNYKYDNKNFNAIEYQKTIYDLGEETLKINNLDNSVNYICDDLKNSLNYFSPESMDVITCNPPYFKDCLNNDNKIKSIARHEIYTSLEEIIKTSSKLLKNNKCLYMVHIPQRLDEIIIICNKYKINVKTFTLVNNSKGETILVLIKAIKNSKQNIKINILNDVNKLESYKNIFEV